MADDMFRRHSKYVYLYGKVRFFSWSVPYPLQHGPSKCGHHSRSNDRNMSARIGEGTVTSTIRTSGSAVAGAAASGTRRAASISSSGNEPSRGA